jgi:hypothetical protein
MPLNDLASIAVILQGLGVIVTLAFLAVELRQNTRALRANAFQTVASEFARFDGQFVYDPAYADLVLRSLVSLEQLTPNERYRVAMAASLRMQLFDSLYYWHRQGVLEKPRWEAFERQFATWIQHPGMRAWWRESQLFYTPEFVAHVNTRILNLDVSHAGWWVTPTPPDDAAPVAAVSPARSAG